MSEPLPVASFLCEDVLPSTLIDDRATFYRIFYDLYVPGVPHRIFRLFLVNLWRGGDGEYVSRTRILTPSGLLAGESEATFVARPTGHHMEICVFDDFWVPEPGEYAAEVYRNDHLVTTYTFVIVARASESEGRTQER